MPELTARGRFRAGDGSRLAWYEGGRPDAPPVVFLSGLGGGVGVWDALAGRLAPHFRLVGWDYRGLYRSGRARRGVAPSMSRHARDLLALLRHAQVDAPILVGWSMGVQLGLEVHRSHPDLARALIGIHGTSGRPFDTAFGSRWSAVVAPPVLRTLGLLERRAVSLGPRLAAAPGVARAFTWLCRGLDLMGPGIDVEAFRQVAVEWTGLDFSVYAETFARLAEHDASDLLPKVTTPTLLIAGGRDPLTPAHLAREMAGLMPDATFALVPEATHFGLLEAPEQIADHVGRFLTRRLGIDIQERCG